MKKIVLILIIVCSFIVGCSKDKAVNEQIASLEKVIEQKDNEIKVLTQKIEEIRNETVAEKASTIEPNLEADKSGISIAGIRLGYNMEQVAEILGTDYVEEEWIYYEEPNIKWIYEDGLSIYFNSGRVHSINLNSTERMTDFGVSIGSSAKEAIDKCSNTFKKYTSIHSFDNKPNLGWYYTDNDEMLILLFNKTEDRFNENVVVDENTNVEKIELSHVSSFD